MVVFDDEERHAGALALDLHRRLERLGVYEPERRAWLPHLTVVRFRRPARLAPVRTTVGNVISHLLGRRPRLLSYLGA